MTTQIRTVYRLGALNGLSGKIDPSPAGPDCVTPEVAKAGGLVLSFGHQRRVLLVVDQRLGGDGQWRETGFNVAEVL